MISFLFPFFLGFAYGKDDRTLGFVVTLFCFVKLIDDSLTLNWTKVTTTNLTLATLIAVPYFISTFFAGYWIGKKLKEA